MTSSELENLFEFGSAIEKIQIEKAKIKKSASNYTTMGELGRVIGWTE